MIPFGLQINSVRRKMSSNWFHIVVLAFTVLSLTARPVFSYGLPATRPTCDRGPGYWKTTLSKFIPFHNAPTNIPPFTSAPSLSFALDGKIYNTTMDTGSTGLLLAAADLPGYDPEAAAKYPIGWQYFTSSNILQAGNWIPKRLSFLDANVTATVPVLAVTMSVICPWYNLSIDTDSCPTSPDGVTAVPTSMPTGIEYMGVGFGREYEGQPQGTPDKVTLLNIDSIDGQPLENGCVTDGHKKSCLNEGYVINKTGVSVGLTEENTKHFSFVKLTLNHSYSDDPRDWTQTPGCVSINGEVCSPGSVLLDTGIPQSYLTVPLSVPVSLAGSELADGVNVTVRFGSKGSYAAAYYFIVGSQGNEMAPTEVIVTQSDASSPFFNTGRHLYRDFDILHDALGGYLGLRWRGNASLALFGQTCVESERESDGGQGFK